MDFDRLSLKIFTLSIVSAVVLTLTVIVSWFFEIDIRSVHLWIGASIALVSVSMIYTAPFYWKIAAIFSSIIAISIFSFFLFGLSPKLSLMIGLASVIFMSSAYLSL